MANLHKWQDREDWLRWAIEFMRRGLWLADEITVHGPHDGSSRMWGDAEGWIDGDDHCAEYKFQAIASRNKYGRPNKYRPKQIRVWDADDKQTKFTVLKISELSPKAQRWFRVARRTLRGLQRKAKETQAARLSLHRLRHGK